jgi:hypothetical protein
MFRHTILLALLLAAGFCGTFLQAQSIEFRPGTVLTYVVKAGSNNYQFIVTFTEVGDSVAFDYEMTAPANKEGSVAISKEAMNSAVRLVNYFGGGPMALTDATTVFLCRDCIWEAVLESGDLMLTLDDQPEPTYFGSVVGPSTVFKVRIDGEEQTMETYSIASVVYNPEEDREDYAASLHVLDNLDYPLLVYMNIGFSIKLVEVQNAD